MRVLFLIAIFAAPLCAGEGFWPLHSLPIEKMKLETGVAFTPEQIQRAMKSAVVLRMATSGGSGGIVSRDGLLVTNRHVIIEFLGSLSPAGRNFVKDGFLATRPEDELPCKGLRARMLVSQEKMTEPQIEPLKRAQGTASELRTRRQLEQSLRAERGMPCEILSLYGGSEFWLYCYKEYSDVRLVYAPDEGLGDFGGREDNFCYPRHEIDVAFLRVYEHGAPAQTPDFLPWAEHPVGEGEPVFVLGHPAENERGAPLRFIRFLSEVRLPTQSAIYGAAAEALRERLKDGGANAARVEAELHRSHNRYKLYTRIGEILSSPAVQAELKEREAGLRKRIEASAEARALLGSAYEDCADACERMKSQGAVVELSDLRQYRLNNVAMTLRQFTHRAADLQGPSLKRITLSIQEYLREGPLNSGFNPAVEEGQLTGALRAAESLLAPGHPLRRAMLNGKAPAEVARQIYRESKLASADECCALVEEGALKIRDSQDPALQFFRAIDQFEHENQEPLSAYAIQDQRRLRALQAIRRAQYAESPRAHAPDANRTARISYGVTAGYTENGAAIPWRTTFRAQIERAEAAKHAPPYALSPLLTEQRVGIDPDTPLNFVITADGGPGCSGAPILGKDGRVAGVFFDGNSQRVASLYYYAQVESGARSIGIHSAAIVLGLQLAGADALIKELRSGAR